MQASVDPTKIYSINGETYPLQSKFFSLGIAANQSLVAGVSGYKVRVMGGIFHTNNAAQGTMQLLDASGGTLLFSYFIPANTAAPLYYPVVSENSLICETSAGNGLFGTVLTQAQVCTLYWIQYK